eukprot:gene10245-2402_t
MSKIERFTYRSTQLEQQLQVIIICHYIYQSPSPAPPPLPPQQQQQPAPSPAPPPLPPQQQQQPAPPTTTSTTTTTTTTTTTSTTTTTYSTTICITICCQLPSAIFVYDIPKHRNLHQTQHGVQVNYKFGISPNSGRQVRDEANLGDRWGNWDWEEER